jgi:hypothetical protein
MMREIRSSDYNEACPVCFSLKLDIIWIYNENDPSSPQIEVSCLECGEVWEDWL